MQTNHASNSKNKPSAVSKNITKKLEKLGIENFSGLPFKMKGPEITSVLAMAHKLNLYQNIKG